MRENLLVPEAPAVAVHGAGILRGDLTHGGHDMALKAVVAFTCLYQRTGHRNTHQCVVGVPAAGRYYGEAMSARN